MVLIIPGMKCPLCTLPIEKGQEIVPFPAFISNRADPLWRFSDSVFHTACFRKEPLSEQAMAVSAKIMEVSTPQNRVCGVCKTVISNPDDYLFLGHLTSDRSHPLYEFNYVHLHLSHATKWEGLERFLEVATKILKQGEWEGAGLGWLIEKLTSVRRLG